MKIIYFIIKALLILIVISERIRFYSNYIVDKQISHPAFYGELGIISLFFYDTFICTITLISVIFFFPLSSLGLIIDTSIKICLFSRNNTNIYKGKYEKHNAADLFTVLLIIIVQILLSLYEYREEKRNKKIVNEDKKRSPRNSNDSKNPSKRRKENSKF